MKMSSAPIPILYQLNTRVYLTSLSSADHRATLDDIPDAELDRLQSLGFDWLWCLSVWKTGPLAQKISREHPSWQEEFRHTLPDLKPDDIGGSGFAIAEYRVAEHLGGNAALARLRERLHIRGMKLMLDFVPNHFGPDHGWVTQHPEYFMEGSEEHLNQQPQNYKRVTTAAGEKILAHGRDPYFDGWPDTFQLDYSKADTVAAMKKTLLRIATLCDGVRCDMAMLILPEVFEKTWQRKALPFWPKVIAKIKDSNPAFCLMAEVYWDMEWALQQLGFDYTYDKQLYDRLREGRARPVREHIYAELDYQNKLVRFLENHDEARAAATFDPDKHAAAAIITYLSRGLRFFHQGQLEGFKMRISPHLIRGPQELVDTGLHMFYHDLLALLRQPLFHARWRLMECHPAWDGNGSWDSYLAFTWEEQRGRRALVVVNFAPHASQCYVRLPLSDLRGMRVEFRDLMSVALYYREGDELESRGMYFDIPAWGYHVFEVSVC